MILNAATDRHGLNTDERHPHPCFIRVRPWPIRFPYSWLPSPAPSAPLRLCVPSIVWQQPCASPLKWIRLAIAVCLLLLCAGIAPAQERPGGKNSNSKKATARKDAKETPITAEKESAVNAFVAEHHPELGELLRHLKGMKNQRPYERAVRELSAASDRLANLQKNDSARYELELKAWKIKSRIQLLSARLTMKDDDQLKNELKAALSEQYDVRREILTAEKSRIQDRLQKLERDLADYDSRREEQIEKQFKQLTTAPKTRPAAKGKSTRSKATTGS